MRRIEEGTKNKEEEERGKRRRIRNERKGRWKREIRKGK
jgi:hypothetical protein